MKSISGDSEHISRQLEFLFKISVHLHSIILFLSSSSFYPILQELCSIIHS